MTVEKENRRPSSVCVCLSKDCHDSGRLFVHSFGNMFEVLPMATHMNKDVDNGNSVEITRQHDAIQLMMHWLQCLCLFTLFVLFRL